MFFVFHSVPNQYKSQETYNKVVSEDPSDMSVQRSKKCGNNCKSNTVGDAFEEIFCI